MMRLLLGLALVVAGPAALHAQAAEPVAQTVPVAIETSAGRIVVALDAVRAPITTANFLRYVDAHRFDGESFYRAMHTPNAEGVDGGLVQGGIRSDARKLFPPIEHEPTNVTGLRNIAGAISMANAGPGTARADFFIMVSDMPGLDAGGPGGDANGFAVFGKVIEGMDIVKAIWVAPVSPTKGDGPMKGQMLDPVVKIIKVSRVK